MFRLFLFLGFLTPVFSALPIVSKAEGRDISKSNTEELAGSFSIMGDSLKTPFRLQVVFEDCNKLKGARGKDISMSHAKLKYQNQNASSKWETIDLRLIGKGRNCFSIIEFYEDVQETYNMELWISLDERITSAGTFFGTAHIGILPKP
jgi:hypothetical protein